MFMSRRSRITALLILPLVALSGMHVHAQSSRPIKIKGADSWSDFIHYIRIALPDRAKEHGKHLLDIVGEDDLRLLRIVEQGPYDTDQYVRTLNTAMRVATLEPVASKLAGKIRKAKIELIRDENRMQDDIRRLGRGGRVRANALQRLEEAGQFATPLLLKTLLGEASQDRELHAHVMSAMVTIGRPLVYPLSIALLHLEPVQQAQVAQVLTDIGYPRAAPYVAELLETQTLDPAARQNVQQVYDRLAAKVRLPFNVSAAELFLTLGENMYDAATSGDVTRVPGYDSKTDRGIVWSYDPQAGLVHTPVPPHVFGDILAMHASQNALRLNPNMNRGLSLWLMSNLRRDNRLVDGETDPSDKTARLPQFYVEMAGPLRQHDVLHRALADGDVALALDAIAALDVTAGTAALVNQEGAIQPLLQALSYPDRRVRFAAAFALTHARPQTEFPGSFRVVPVLTEAVRQADQHYALVLARGEDSLNRLLAAIEDIPGTQAIGGLSLEDPSLAKLIRSGPGIDLTVTDLRADECLQLLQKTESDYHLAGAPIVALVPESDQIQLSRWVSENSRLSWADPELSKSELAALIEDRLDATAGAALSQEQADEFAHRAINLLRQIALSRGDIFNVQEALPALMAALHDSRPPIVKQAGQVLAILGDGRAQQALAESGLDETRSTDVRVSLLNSLAQSAKHFGNQLTPDLVSRLLELVKVSRGKLANATARAHGALSLPTSHLKEMIDE